MEDAAGYIIGAIFNITFIGIIIWVVYYHFVVIGRRAKERTDSLGKIASVSSLHFDAAPPWQLRLGGSYPDGMLSNEVSGKLQESLNKFIICDQMETRGSGKNQQLFYRTICCVEIPNTKIQMIINSQINNDEASGGNLAKYRKSQHYEAEGNFHKYFDIYIPRGGEAQALALLSPDVLEFIMHNLAGFDIEIVDNKLYLYHYKLLDVDSYTLLIDVVDKLIDELKLRPGDTRKRSNKATIARATVGQKDSIKLLRGWRLIVTDKTLLIIFFGGMAVLPSLIIFVANEAVMPVFLVGFSSVLLIIILGRLIRSKSLKKDYLEEVRLIKKE